MSEQAFPLAAPAFDGNSRVVEPGNGLEWLKQGWALFIVAPAQWLGITLVFLAIMIALYKIPLIGRLVLAHVAMPILAAGTLLACQKAAFGKKPQLGDLFAGFRRNAHNLMLLGVLYLAGILGLAGIVFAVGGGTVAGGLALGESAGIGLALGGFVLAVLLAFALAVPLLMAMWFAPALVFFNNMPPVAALKASFDACFKNGVAFVVHGLFAVVLLLFATLPAGLGLLVLIPVLCGSVYASYRDIFVAD